MYSRKMTSQMFLVISVGLLFLANVVPAAELSFCSTDKSKTCEGFRGDGQIRCATYNNSFDCLKSVGTNGASFALLNPQQALLGSQVLQDVEVVAEVRDANRAGRSTDFDLVVTVKDGGLQGFGDLRGKRLCHPGFAQVDGAKQLYSAIDSALIGPIECSIKEPSAIHRRIKAMEDFFGGSCLPGPWVENATMDGVLKSQHKNLCKLCDGCGSENATDPFAAAQECCDRAGDVCITTAEIAKKQPSPIYLCSNGSTSLKECVWTSKSWPVIIAKKESADEVRRVLTNNLIASQLVASAAQEVVVLKDSKNLEDYVLALNALPVKLKCPEVLKWCATSEVEMVECGSLMNALYTQGVLPEVNCVRKSDELECLESIKETESDIMAVSTRNGYTARSKLLRPIAFPAADAAGVTKSMIVVKAGSKKILSLHDLAMEFGCFAEFGDISLVAFLQALQRSGAVEPSCSLGTTMDAFLGESCVPGINDQLYEEVGVHDTARYCSCQGSPTSRTASTCSANSDNEYQGNVGALKCLKEIGMFAVITDKGVDDFIDDKTLYVLCKNGSLGANPGLRVNDDCYLSVTSNSEIVIRRKDPKLKDAVLMLLDIERDLERHLGLFGGLKNLIFKGSDPVLFFDAGESVYVENYLDVFKGHDVCVSQAYMTNRASESGLGMAYTLAALFICSLFLSSF